MYKVESDFNYGEDIAMTNCPKCSAPIDPYSWRCAYCGTYVFDFSAWDLTDSKPTFVKFKTSQGTITSLAKPELKTVEVRQDSENLTAIDGNRITRIGGLRHCVIDVNFSCIPNPKSGELFRVEVE